MHFTSNGKFLLTGEYLVLKGAVALALPLKLGQSMEVETLDSDEGLIYWNAFIKATSHGEDQWFHVVLDKNNFNIKDSDDHEKAERLSYILSQAKSLNEDIFLDTHDYKFSTCLNFSPQWGLGSSSTLINNISEWAEINPYDLLENTFKGSGYDIACAKADRPIFYKVDKSNGQRTNETTVADFKPSFRDKLYFVYLGHKQISSKEVKAFLDKDKDYTEEVKLVSEISRSLPNANDFIDFCRLIDTHEDIIASCIGRPSVRNDFPDFGGTLKSLGAWGGDFIMAATEWEKEKVKSYFKNKGLDTVIEYKDIVL